MATIRALHGWLHTWTHACVGIMVINNHGQRRNNLNVTYIAMKRDPMKKLLKP